MNKRLIWGSALILILIGVYFLFEKKETIADLRYGPEIQKLTTIIAEKKCDAGDENYIALAQDYTYVKEYKKALAIYDSMSDCYPNAYQVASEKYMLLLNNRAAVYEDWGYYLENTEKDKMSAEKKYQEAIKLFNMIIQTFSGKIEEDTIDGYQNRIEQIKKYHLQ